MPYCIYCNKYFSINYIQKHQSTCSEKPKESTEVHFKSFYKYDKLNANVLWPIDIENQKKNQRKDK
jgi:hypothetical protein